jgi:hypothetical protein
MEQQHAPYPRFARKFVYISQLHALEKCAFGQLDQGAGKRLCHDWTAQKNVFSPIINEPYGTDFELHKA